MIVISSSSPPPPPPPTTRSETRRSIDSLGPRPSDVYSFLPSTPVCTSYAVGRAWLNPVLYVYMEQASRDRVCCLACAGPRSIARPRARPPAPYPAPTCVIHLYVTCRCLRVHGHCSLAHVRARVLILVRVCVRACEPAWPGVLHVLVRMSVCICVCVCVCVCVCMCACVCFVCLYVHVFVGAVCSRAGAWAHRIALARARVRLLVRVCTRVVVQRRWGVRVRRPHFRPPRACRAWPPIRWRSL